MALQAESGCLGVPHEDAPRTESGRTAQDIGGPFVVRNVIEDMANEPQINRLGDLGVGNRAGNNRPCGQDRIRASRRVALGSTAWTVRKRAGSRTSGRRSRCPVHDHSLGPMPGDHLVQQRSHGPLVIAAQQGLEIAGIGGAVGV